MLDWCRNGGHADATSQIILPPPSSPSQGLPKLTKPPSFALPAPHPLNSRDGNPAVRRGIKTHFNRTTRKTDKHAQTCIQRVTCTVDSSTQTPRIMLEQSQNQRRINSVVCSRQTSPQHNLGEGWKEMQNTQCQKPNIQSQRPKISFLRVDNKGSELLPSQMDNSLRKTVDFKLDTRATNCLVETRDRIDRSDRSRFCGAIGVESYHFPVNRSYTEQPGSIEVKAQEAKGGEVKEASTRGEVVRVERRESGEDSPQSMRSIGRFQQSEVGMSLSKKYRQMLKNVQSEFKLSQKKQSQRRFKNTPDRRILFYQRETIVSKYNNEQNRSSSQSLMVEQSILLQPDIRSLFTPLSGVQRCGCSSMYLALQNLLGMVVSIKQIGVGHMVRISEQLLVYKEMETRQEWAEGVLRLFQTQIDHGCYMLIKQPYTQTLRRYLQEGGGMAEVTGQLQVLLERMEAVGFMLRGRVEVQDVVLCLGRVKLHNAALLTLDRSCQGVGVQEAVEYLRGQMLEQQRDY